ncbi:hypothetical protein [Clostridium gasigenes]|nr:hypothetical protein [Clostridium gasigenes]
MKDAHYSEVDNLASKVYYQYGNNKLEKTTAEHWKRIINSFKNNR